MFLASVSFVHDRNRKGIVAMPTTCCVFAFLVSFIRGGLFDVALSCEVSATVAHG
jgi:hypothetical protein